MEWLDRAEYPFEDRFLDVEGGRMHYVDEGRGDAILFVHGTPSWSFEFRHVIQGLRATHRCVAPDHIGFGLSGKPEGWSYALEDHSRNLEKLIDHLGLERVTLVAGDFGAPIALAVALRRPGLLSRLVLTNSWLWPMGEVDPAFARQAKLMRGGLMRFLYLRWNFSPRMMVRMAWGKRAPLTRAIHRHYLRPFGSAAERRGCWAFVLAVTDEAHPYWGLWKECGALAGVPTRILWGMRDKLVHSGHLAKWREVIPHARVTEIADAGHFVAEEAPDLLVQATR